MTPKSRTRWLEISVRTTGAATRAVAGLLDRHGEGGSVTEVAIGRVSPGAPENRGAVVRAYLPVNGAGREKRKTIEAGLARLRRRHRLAAPSFRELRERDWAEEWKKDFKIVRIASRLVIVPSWRNYAPKKDEIVIRIDPGMAFGTGLHPTTRLCLEALVRTVRPGGIVLDVGTGSGILAIAAMKLGAKRVIALDTDPAAVAAARGNLALNGIRAGVSLGKGTLKRTAIPRVDLIAVNILARTIRTLAADLAGSLRVGGRVIASGLLEEQEEEVSSALGAAGLRIVGRRRRKGWALLLAVLPKNP